MPTSASAPVRVRAGRDPAIAIWTVAAACWVVTVGLVLAVASGPCHETAVLDGTAQRPPARPAIALAAWLVMAGAMMLPTIVPLIRLFVPVTARVPHPVVVRLALLAGYLAVWAGFTTAAVVAADGVRALLQARPWPVAPSDLMLGGTLVLAGLFQFSRLKHTCLTRCRSPWALLWQHYRRGVRGGWTLGVRHGVLCLGCCWALMLVMFGAGVSSLLWMLALTAFMSVEQTARFGARMVAPLGGALVLAGATVLVLSVAAVSADTPAGSGGAVAPEMVALLVTAVGLAVLGLPKGGRARLTDRAAVAPRGTRAEPAAGFRPRPHDTGEGSVDSQR